MTSPSTSVAFDKLGDLRNKHHDNELAQNYVLTKQLPVKYNPTIAERAGEHRFDARETAALDAVIVVARHLLAMVTTPHRQIGDQNPLACMIWADLTDPRAFEQQHQARYAILSGFREKYKDRLISFYNLIENKEMWDTFWSIPPFQLWHPVVMAKREGEMEWIKAEIESQRNLTKDALVQYRGHGDLSDHINAGFGTFVDDESGVLHHWQSNDPIVIRVNYRHEAEGIAPKTWNDLQEIQVRPHRLFDVRGDGGRPCLEYDTTGGQPKRYTLLAVVRVGGHKAENDCIRLYGVDSEYVDLPKEASHLSGASWRLGDKGDRYLLYYILAPTRLVGGNDQEIVYRQPHAKEKRSTAKAAAKLKPGQAAPVTEGA
ncbi:hypothetical protein K449DRAFT_442608 [Hypoxylon sp. EC38]|nr:hypothetical protein K449DRAFT_442608 [Hypoxylon sp. EC38]